MIEVSFSDDYPVGAVIGHGVAIAHELLREDGWRVSIVSRELVEVEVGGVIDGTPEAMSELASKMVKSVAFHLGGYQDAKWTVTSTVFEDVEVIQLRIVEIKSDADRIDEMVEKGVESAMLEMGGLLSVLVRLRIVKMDEIRALTESGSSDLDNRVEGLVLHGLRKRGLRTEQEALDAGDGEDVEDVSAPN